MSGTLLPFEILVKLSHDEFIKYVSSNTTITDKDISLMVMRFENDVLEKIKHKDGENSERYIFYNRVLKIMYMAMQAEENVNFWKNVAIRSKMEAEFHAQNAAIYYNDLMKLKALDETINSGNLDEYITNHRKRTGK